MSNLRTSLMFLALVVSFGCGSPTRNSYTCNGNSGGSGSNPPPPVTSSVSITSLSPASVTAGNPDFTLIIIGSGFPAVPLDYKDHPAVWWAPHGIANGVHLSVDNTQSGCHSRDCDRSCVPIAKRGRLRCASAGLV